MASERAYLICADDDSNVFQYFIPNPLITPPVDTIGSRKESCLHEGKLSRDNIVPLDC